MKRLDVLSKLDLAVVLSVFIGVCYVFTYLYYIGRFSYYSIPVEFIDIDAKDVFLTMLILSPSILVFIVNVVLNLRNEIQTNWILNKKERDKIITLHKEINNLGTKNKKTV